MDSLTVPPPGSPGWRPRILLVDDHPENILALVSLLRDEQVEVLKASSGEEALALLLREPVALAVLDVNMPNMSGYELAELMRGAERTKRIPIIFLTAGRPDETATFRGYESGAVDYLFKPVEPVVFLSKVRVFLDMARQRRELEDNMRELQVARDVAQQANRAKSVFLANMSHEIRTPLGAILGFADLATNPNPEPGELDQCLSAIRRNGQQLLGILNDVLDISKIEAGKLQLEAAWVDLAPLLRDLAETFTPLARDKGLAFAFSTAGALPGQLRSDPTRLKQVLMNLLSNALKFTAQGAVRLTAQQGRDPRGAWLRFEVTDTGIGIAPEHRDQLFSPFTQADGSMTRRFGGTGLGLAISRRLTEALGGTLSLALSEPGKGSVFALELRGIETQGDDFTVSETDDEPGLNPRRFDATGDSGPLSGIRILLVEDSPDNREIVGRFLAAADATVDFAEDGFAALSKCREGSFDLVLMDIQMPGKDGYRTTEELRGAGFASPIVALTAHGMREERERCLAAGCTEHLVKPVNRHELVETVRRVVLEHRDAGAQA